MEEVEGREQPADGSPLRSGRVGRVFDCLQNAGSEHVPCIDASAAPDKPCSRPCWDVRLLLEQQQDQLCKLMDMMVRQESILERALASEALPLKGFASNVDALSGCVHAASVAVSVQSSARIAPPAPCSAESLARPLPSRPCLAENDANGHALSPSLPFEHDRLDLVQNVASVNSMLTNSMQTSAQSMDGVVRHGDKDRESGSVPHKCSSWFTGFNSRTSGRPPSCATQPRIKPKDPQEEPWSIRGVAKGTKFEFCIALAILSNSMFIGIETNYLATSGAMQSPPHFYVIQHAYTILFLLELLLRVWVLRGDFFGAEERGWNIFDSMLVFCSLLETIVDILEVVPGGYGVKQLENMRNVRIARVVRVTRVVRIFRISRVVRFVRTLRTLVHSIVCSLRSVVWALLLLLVIIYCFAIIFTQAFVDHCNPKKQTTDAEQCSPGMERWWSDLLSSMFTLFKCISGGVSWTEVSTPLGDISFLCVGMFCAYVAFTCLAVLNVVTGVFCQSAFESAQRDRDLVVNSMLTKKKDFVSEIQKLFKQIDADESGTITVEEFENHIQDDAVQAYFAALELDTSDAWTFFRLLDTDRTEEIDIEDFVMGCAKMKGAAKGIDLAKLLYEQKRMMKGLQLFAEHIDEQFFGQTAIEHIDEQFTPSTR